MGSRIALLAVSMLVAWLRASASAQGGEEARIARGRQVVAQACTTCHTTLVRMLQVHKQTAEQWKDTVYFMISRGAQVMPDEIEAVAAFLAETSGNGRPAARDAGQPGRGAGGAPVLQRNCQQCPELATASAQADSEEGGAGGARMMAYRARVTPAD